MQAKVLTDFGTVFDSRSFHLVHKALVKDEKIPEHEHPGETVFIIPVKGKVQVKLDRKTVYELQSGQILQSQGQSIEILGLALSEMVIALAKLDGAM